MRTRVPLGGVAAALLFWAAPAHAEFWVSVGAFRDAQSAVRLANEASAIVGIPFASMAMDTDHGPLHRVAYGPMGTREEAVAEVERVRQGGFADAWVVEIDAGAPAASDMDLATPAGTDDTPASTDAERSDLPSIEELLRELPDLPPAGARPLPLPDSEGEQDEPEIVVPDDYQLHKLKRANAAFFPSAAEVDGHFFDARLKWYTAARSLPADDALRRSTGDATPLNHNADLRMMWRRQAGRKRVLVAHSTTWIRSDIASASPGLTFDQTPTGDERRVANLTWQVDEGEQGSVLHRFDRLALEYRASHWALTAGRQAVSWGGGLVFQPMDLFNPFAPTTVDQDYKAGDDLVLFERLFPSGADLQLLAVGRRTDAEDLDFDVASIAAKYRAVVGESELELMAANHYGGQVYGLGLRVPAGGALVRSDLTWAVGDDDVVVSAVLNADYAFDLANTMVHVFAEYFHNGFGVTALPESLRDLPFALTRRIARGELFNLMRNYLALGTSFRWHILVNQSLALIANLHDGSFATQASLAYDVSDASRLHIGLTKPFGSAGDEFGGVTVGEGLTVGGGTQGFLRFVYFF